MALAGTMASGSGSTREGEVWVQAAIEVLTQIGVPLHYADIKRFVLEKNMVAPGLGTTLEAALFREVQKVDSRLRLVDGQAGVFMLAAAPIVRRVHHLGQGQGQSQGHVRVRPTLTSQASQARYQSKYKRLKKYVKQLMFMNAAICDEVIKIEDKISQVREHRRFLLRKLVQQQAISDVLSQVKPGGSPTALSLKHTTQSVAQLLGVAERKKKKPPVTAAVVSVKKKTTRELLEESVKTKTTAKKGKQLRRTVHPIPLDKLGRPIFPIELGPLTVYCLGEITADPAYHSADYIYPVGFCSTRLYASLGDPTQTCLYTCKIAEGHEGPEFEISAEDSPDQVIAGSDAISCHQQLLQAINAASATELIPPDSDKGPDFFGFCQPSVQHLIQSMPGARKCTQYKWLKFEVKKEGQMFVETDAAVSYHTLCNQPAFQNMTALGQQSMPGRAGSHPEQPHHLRHLLTSAAVSGVNPQSSEMNDDDDDDDDEDDDDD